MLRPGAVDKLRPLADYLRDNPGVRVAIDGHTDSRGTDAHNEDAVASAAPPAVRAAFDEMGRRARALHRCRAIGERTAGREQRDAAGHAARTGGWR